MTFKIGAYWIYHDHIESTIIVNGYSIIVADKVIGNVKGLCYIEAILTSEYERLLSNELHSTGVILRITIHIRKSVPERLVFEVSCSRVKEENVLIVCGS